MLKTSTLQSLYDGQFTLSNPLLILVLDQSIIPKLIFVFILIAPFQLFKFHLPN